MADKGEKNQGHLGSLSFHPSRTEERQGEERCRLEIARLWEQRREQPWCESPAICRGLCKKKEGRLGATWERVWGSDLQEAV